MAWPHSHLLLSIAMTFTLAAVSNSGSLEMETSNTLLGVKSKAPEPRPKAWPEQFHALLVMNYTKALELQVIDLWYDWPNGRNLNLIQHQLGKLVHDVEWDNGTSFFYTLGVGSDGGRECRMVHVEVGILRPNWLEGATYLGQSYVDGFLCNVWEKVDFIWYYEDVVTKRPVHWLFYTGRAIHVITFEVGAVLEDSKWQAPVYCFNKQVELHGSSTQHTGLLRPTAAFV